MKDAHECTVHYCEGGMKNEDLLDIMIVSYGRSETASLWVTYLTSCFQQISKEQNRPPFKLVCVQLEDIFLGVTSMALHDRLAKARLQIVILCPGFLEQISANPGPASVLTTLLQPGRAIVMLLGVSDESVTIQHRAALLCFDEWRKVVVKDQDPNFVGDFLGVAMDILSRSWQIQQAINQLRNDENKAYFSIIPKKIKVGQNKLIVLLNDPLRPDDKIHITIDKNGQRLEANSVKRRNPYTLQFTMPATCLQVSMLASIFVEKNGKPLGHRLVKCESRMRELDQLLRSTDNPLQFMCQTLGLNPGERDQLDLFLAAALQRNLPPHFNLLQPPIGHQFHSSNEEYPTLLHFAARFGLEKLSWFLLECPGGEQACQLRNACQLTPADMAERAGHAGLASALKGYLQMAELSSMYSCLKGISGKQTPGFSDANYLLPRPLNDTYLIPPTARPISISSTSLTISPSTVTSTTSCPTTPVANNFMHFYSNLESYKVPPSPVLLSGSMDYNIPPLPLPLQLDSVLEKHHNSTSSVSLSSTPTTPSSPKDSLPPGLYMEMHSPTDGRSVNKQLCNQLCCDHNSHREQSRDQNANRLVHTVSVDSVSGNHVADCSGSGSCRKNSTSSSTSTKHSQHGVQDELVEIINDFKNNVFTIAEVETLVANWQKRHDVQQSFKEKQDQLNAMRDEYERIQQAMKHQMKRATPFERIRKFFSRGKTKHAACSEECRRSVADTSSTNNHPTNVCHRPASSLSLRSSCSSASSGRMSTGSGTSLGDSGTHSDPDDKKGASNDGQIRSVQRDARCKQSSSSLNYDVPPSSLEIRLARPPPLTDLTEYVKPDNPKPSTPLSMFCRSTSLTEEDTIEEVLENSAGDSCSTVDNTQENNETNTEKTVHVAESIDEADREIAVVEVHPPPLKEITGSTTASTESNLKVSNLKCTTDQQDSSKTNKCNVNDIATNNKSCASTQNENIESTKNSSHLSSSSNCCDVNYVKRDTKLIVRFTNDRFTLHNYNDLNGSHDSNERLTIDKFENGDYNMDELHNANIIPEDYEYNSDEESAKETDQLLENLQLHDYINVTGYQPPPVPPRGKYNHVTL